MSKPWYKGRESDGSVYQKHKGTRVGRRHKKLVRRAIDTAISAVGSVMLMTAPVSAIRRERDPKDTKSSTPNMGRTTVDDLVQKFRGGRQTARDYRAACAREREATRIWAERSNALLHGTALPETEDEKRRLNQRRKLLTLTEFGQEEQTDQLPMTG